MGVTYKDITLMRHRFFLHLLFNLGCQHYMGQEGLQMVQIPYLPKLMLDAISSSLQVLHSAKACSGSSCDGVETAETKATFME